MKHQTWKTLIKIVDYIYIYIWDTYTIWPTPKTATGVVSKAVAQEYYFLVMMRKLAFYCLLFSTATYCNMAYGLIGICGGYSASRSDTPNENKVRDTYNTIISRYDDYLQNKTTKTTKPILYFGPDWKLADKKPSPVDHLENLLDENKYIPTSSSTVLYHGTYICMYPDESLVDESDESDCTFAVFLKLNTHA
jgi:hypothetical protein